MTLREEIEDAIADYSLMFHPPYSLAPNLSLASRALAELYAVEQWEKGYGYHVHDTPDWGGEAAWELGELIERVGTLRVTPMRCQERESGGVQCDLVLGHKSGHWIDMSQHVQWTIPKEDHPERWRA